MFVFFFLGCVFVLVVFYFIGPFLKQRLVCRFTRPPDFLQARRPAGRGRGDTTGGSRKACNVCGICASLPVSYLVVSWFLRYVSFLFSRLAGNAY